MANVIAMRKIVALLTVAALLAAAVTAYASTTTVAWKVGSTKTIKIRKGASVKWVWADSQPHNLKGPGVSTKVVARKGFSFTRKFTKAGTFRYICLVHANMKTTVKVG